MNTDRSWRGAAHVLLPAACLAAIAVGGVRAQNAAAPGAVTVPADGKTLLYVGRWDRRDPTMPHSHWGGAYLRTRFTGTSVGINMATGNALAVSIDGEPFRAVNGVQGLTLLNAAPLAPGPHTLLVGPSEGGEGQVTGLTLDPGAVTRPPTPRPIIEFIGDSITWGTGPQQGLWNVNWTWQTAEALGCDHTQVAQSARALTTGYGCADEHTGMDKQYFMLKNFGYVHEVPPVPWDFAAYTPQIVVINLGQNDACGNEQDDVFTASYVHFIQNVRAKFPRAQIVALRMFGGGHFGDDTQKAVAAVNAAGDTRVHFIDTAGWLDNPADFQDGVHPNAVGNFKAAVRLAPLLKPLLPPGAQVALSSQATTGDPAHPNALAQDLQNAYIRGARRIVVTPGTYTLSNGGNAEITLSRWQDATVSAPNATLMVDNRAGAGRLFLLDHCVNTTIVGALLSQTAQTAYQGHVLSIDTTDLHHPSCVWRPSAGYPVPPADTKQLWINVVDAKTRTLNLASGDYYHASLQPLGDGRYKIGLEDRPVAFHVGDWIVARYGDPPNKVFLDTCTDCTLKDVTMMRNGFAPIFDGGSGNHILHCRWTLGPRPAGATEDSVVTNAADGLHSPGATVGPDIEDCTFEGVFLDDCIAIHGGFHTIKSVNGPVITADNAYADYVVGEPVRISNDHGFYLQANVTALKDNKDGTTTLTLDTTQTIPMDAHLSTPLHDGAGYKIINCRLGNTRSRGIIVKADHGTIEGNVISHCGLGLRIGPEWPQEADYSQHVLVTGNTLAYNDDGLVVDGSGSEQNTDITIRDNRFVGNQGRDLSVNWASGVTIRGNVFTAPAVRAFGAKPLSPIALGNSSGVTLSANRIAPSDAYAKPYVSVGDNVAQLTQDMAAASNP